MIQDTKTVASSLLCWLGFHKWGRWIFHRVDVTYPFSNTPTCKGAAQKRECLRCGYSQVEVIN